MSSEIQARVVDRFVATGKSDEPWAHIVLAAMESADQLDAFLDKKTSITPDDMLVWYISSGRQRWKRQRSFGRAARRR